MQRLRVLSTMGQVDILTGIAVLGALLQKRITANITGGIQAVQGIREAVEQKIVAGAGRSALQMGLPKGAAGRPAPAQAMMEAMFKNWFPNAVANTFVGSAILAVSGGLCAFPLSATRTSHASPWKPKRRPEAPQARPSPKLATPDQVPPRPAKEIPTAAANDTAPEVVTYGCPGGTACPGRRRACSPD